MKTSVALSLFMLTTVEAFGEYAGCLSFMQAMSDTSDTLSSRNSSRPQRWVNIDIGFGEQFLHKEWEPYSKTEFLLSVSAQVRLGKFPYLLDGAFVAGHAGKLSDSGPAGPGTTFIELHNGLGEWWYLGDSPVSLYVGAGLTYVWGKLEAEDHSKPPIEITPDLHVYPDKSESGNFWGGYFRTGMVWQVGDIWQVGAGIIGMLTTNRTILGRKLNINSIAFTVFFGGGE